MKIKILILYMLIASSLFGRNKSEGWKIISTGINNRLNNLYFLDSLTGWVCGDNGVIIKTTNGGQNWNSLYTNSSENLFSIYFQNDQTGYSVGSNQTILKTSTGGTDWIKQFSGISSDFNFLQVLNDSIIIVGGSSSFLNQYSLYSVYKSSDNGSSWKSLISSEGIGIKYGYFSSPENGIIVGAKIESFKGNCVPYLVFKKTINGGINWTTSNGFPSIPHGIKFFNESEGYAIGNTFSQFCFEQAISVFYETTNGGLSWVNHLLLLQTLIKTFDFFNKDIGLIAGDGKIFKTTDGGDHFYSQNVNLNFYPNSILYYNKDLVFISCDSGIILKTNTGGEPVGIDFINEKVDNYSLSQNYPNPFNPKTIINYELRVTSNAKLKVFDVLGNEIATLVNEKQNSGSYSVEFDGSGFASGIYFYRLSAGDFVETKRMMLLK